MKDLSLLLMVFKLGPPRRHTKGHHIALRAQIPFSSAQSASVTDWDRTIVRNEKIFLARSIFDRQTTASTAQSMFDLLREKATEPTTMMKAIPTSTTEAVSYSCRMPVQ